MRSPDIEMAVRLYYEKPEITNADIKELFSTGETQTIKFKYTTSHHFLLLYKIACKPRIYII